MHGFPSTINSRQDVYNMLPLYPFETRAYVTRLLDEHKSWQDGQYLQDQAAWLYKIGLTVAECLEIVGDYVDPPIPDQPPTPEEQVAAELDAWRESASCGPLQFRRALRAAGLMDSVKAFLETAPEEVIEAWEYATVVYRSDPMLISLSMALGKTDDELDDLIRMALTFK